jgi:uncharacterized phage-associated protein
MATKKEQNERLERLIEATVALLENAPGRRMQVTNLNKALFYLDLLSLRDKGRTVTDNVYVALEQGPVMNGYQNELETLSRIGLLRQDDNGMDKPVVLQCGRDTYRYMDDYLRATAAEVSRRIAAKSATDVSKFSHKNPGWISAYGRGKPNSRGAMPINMRVAMQQVVDDDPWLTSPPDEEVSRCIGAAEPESGEPW